MGQVQRLWTTEDQDRIQQSSAEVWVIYAQVPHLHRKPTRGYRRPPDAERNCQANTDKWRTDKAWVERILDETFPDKEKTAYDNMRSALIAHWDAMRDKGLIHTQMGHAD